MKLTQAGQVCEFLSSHSVGDNYDYSDIKTFVPLVVSPFVEWLPDNSEKYWLTNDTPRVMSAEELVDFVQEHP
jgi:hypothetical protein